MKPYRRLNSLLISLLLIASLLGACAPTAASNATVVAPKQAPAQVQPTKAPEATKVPEAPAVAAQPTFDLNAKVTDFVTTLPDGYFGVKNTDALKALQADPKPFLIDLREAKEITQTIEGAVNIPVRSLLDNLDKLPAKDAPILLYCGIGHRGGIASALLPMLGYTNAKSISGGFSGWKAASLPIVDGGPVEPQASGVKVDVDQELFTALNTWLKAMPDDYYGIPTASVAKALAADPKPFVIDVRTPQEIADAGYIDGSINIPMRDLAKNLDKLPADKNAPILTYCAVGQRGSIAMTALRLMGYTDVKSISGGFNKWKKDSLPVVGGKPAFDLNAKVTDFVTNLPDGYFGMKNTDALKALQADPKPFLIDLREAKEITQTIEGAVNIPVRSLLKNLDKLPAKDAPILLYCGVGHRGGIASTLLQMLGYKNAKSISGGFNGWKAASLPIVDGGPVEPKASGVTVDVDKDLFAALDAWLATMPDDFWGMPPTSVAKAMAGDPKPFLIDVRTPEEIKDAGTIEGSVNIPIRDLAKSLDKLPADKAAPIITYCAVGQRGAIALTALRLLGYTNVKSMGGGFNSWVKNSLPVVK
jgi:rhodanese-related sulfurtransferase